MARRITKRLLRNKNRYQPKKSPAERRRREKVQRRRLIRLGMPAEVVEKLDPVTVRTLLRHPARLVRRLQTATT